MTSFAFIGVCFCEAIWVAAGVRQPVDFKAEMQPIYLLQTFSRVDFKADVKPLYLLQTQTRDSLKVERHHIFTSGFCSIGQCPIAFAQKYCIFAVALSSIQIH